MATRTRAHDFFDADVVPAVEEWRKAATDKRLAMVAAQALNNMADHYWHAYGATEPSRVFGTPSVKAFRAEFAKQNPQWSLVRDVAEAHKHVTLTRTPRAVTSIGQAFVATTGWSQTGYGTGPYGPAPSLIVEQDNGQRIHFSAAVNAAVQHWESLLK